MSSREGETLISSVLTLGGYRTAVNNRFRVEDLGVPADISRRIKKFHSGLKRTTTKEVVDGKQSVVVQGKEPIPFECYLKSAKYFWTRSSPTLDCRQLEPRITRTSPASGPKGSVWPRASFAG